ncbi:MAG: GH32 C-terminal domain-containing protein, partial [Thermomicrobiales bacterium]
GWMRERRGDDAQVADGWSGVMTLPRLLSIADDGTLHSAPAPENDLLRGDHATASPADIAADGTVSGIAGDALEALATFTASDGPVGLIVRRDPATGEQVTITVDPATGEFILDTSGSSTDAGTFGMRTVERVAVRADEPITLRVYVDRSIVEVFFNDRIAISDRISPRSHDATGVAVIGAHALRSLDAWRMTSFLDESPKTV